MKQKSFLLLILLTVVVAFGLSGFSVLFLNRTVSINNSQHRDRFLQFFSESLQNRIKNLSHSEIKTSQNLFEHVPPPPFGGPPPGPPPLIMPPPPPMPPPQLGAKRPRPEPQFWIFDGQGQVLNQSKTATPPQPPPQWRRFEKPNELGEMTAEEDFFRIAPAILAVKIQTAEAPVFLVMLENPRPLFNSVFVTQALLSFGTAVATLSFAFFITFLYLRNKSAEARIVLRKLEQGDLKTRFEIKRVDEFGALLLDFNRMADEIEKLVNRIYQVESTRKNLLQELGHDVRTPLTSLKTSFETLKQYGSQMTPTERDGILTLINGEIDYLNELFEKLMTVASLDEPHYNKNTQIIALNKILETELESRKNQSALTWILPNVNENFEISGDAHLISRLFKNALDNASRFAKSKVEIDFKKDSRNIEVHIRDDGPGFDSAALTQFGKRREFSGRQIKAGQHISLGLGSVIMQAIAELHGGRLRAENNAAGGAHLILIFPLPS